MEKIFYQSSLPRSGSTLLQNILAQNSDIYATPTSGVLELVFAARGNYTDSPEFQAQDSAIMKTAFQAFCRFGMEAYYNAITNKKYIVDKSRGWGIHYSFLDSVFPNPKIICMVRDLRDIYCSMEKNFRKNPEKASPLVDWSKMQGTTIPKRIDLWANGVPVGMALERLSEIIRLGTDKHMLFIKYEDLCMYPDAEMTKIYKFFELEYFEHDFDNIEQATKEDDEVYGVFGDHTIRQKLEPMQSQAKAVLGKDVCDWIYNNYAWFYQYFGYKK